MEKAKELKEVYKALIQKPLTINDLEDFYIDANKARGEKTRSKLALLLKNNMDLNQHILFVGYRGCGKSTELNHLEKDIQDDFLVVNFSIFDELDPNNFNYIELVIVTMEKLFSFVEKHNITLEPVLIDMVSDFFKITEIEEISETHKNAEANIGVEGGYNIPFISKLLVKLTASIKRSNTVKKTIKDTIEPKFSNLLMLCNSLITEIRTNLSTLGKKDILIIIEDLDKANISQSESLFFEYANQITALKANVIFTFPVALKHNSRFKTIENYFSNTYELPMIKIAEKNSDIAQEGVDTMKKIVEARMNLSLFKNENILQNLIRYSGGCIRDLFDMISDASENAMVEDRKQICSEDEKSAYNKIKKNYNNTIADYVVDNEVKIPASEFYKVLNNLNENKKKTINNSLVELLLLQNLTILGYNGEGWFDVHPIVKDILEYRNS